MTLKHNSENPFHQASCVECLQQWYAGPQGQRVLAMLGEEFTTRGQRLRFGDAVLELTPISLLQPDWTGSAWGLGIGPAEARLRARPDQLPLPARSFSAVLVAHAGLLEADGLKVIIEAARVLAPEGHLFFLEITACLPREANVLKRALSVGLQRRLYRQWLDQAGLRVRRQRTLSLLPSRLPVSWHRALGSADAWVAPWLPLPGSCVLTVAQRRDAAPLAPRARWRWQRVPVRAAGGSQWA